MEMVLKTVAICVLYQTDKSFFKRLKTFSKECDTLIIIDNGCDAKFTSQLNLEIKKNNIKIIYKKNNTNVGLAKAQNTGILLAKELKAKYILFFDDDSLPSKNLRKQMVSYLEANPDVGIVAPDIIHSSEAKQLYWVKNDFFWKRRRFYHTENVLKNVNTVISSGSMIPMHTINQVGLFRDDFFIDYIDIEYCLRVRKYGFRIDVIKAASLYHMLGERITKTFIGMSISPTNHSPLRKYYMTRNRIKTWKLYAFVIPSWFLIDLLNFMYDTFRTVFFENEKKAKIQAILKGFFEGIWF